MKKIEMKKIVFCVMTFTVCLIFSFTANASVTIYTDRTSFSAQGTIAYNYGFEDVTLTSGQYNAPDPWSTNGVTYRTGDNFVIGPTQEQKPISNVFIYNAATPIYGTIDSTYNMFGFDLGYVVNECNIDIRITTNLGTYTWLNQVVPRVSQGMSFFGFIGNGENIVSFILSSPTSHYPDYSGPAIDNVTLGNAATVPIPAAMWLLGSGLISLIGIRRFRK